MKQCKFCNEDISGYAHGTTFCWRCAWGGWRRRGNPFRRFFNNTHLNNLQLTNGLFIKEESEILTKIIIGALK